MQSRLRLVWLALVCVGAFATPAAAVTDDLEAAAEERAAIEERLATVTAELDELAVRITDAEDERDALEAEVAALQNDAEEAEVALQGLAVSAYMHGQSGPVEVIVTAGRSAEAAERARLMAVVGRADAATIERAEVARTGLATRRERLDEVLAQLDADQARADELRADLDEAFEIAAAREDELASRRDRQREVSRDRQHGTYACPLGGPLHFRDTWGDPRSGGRSHKGVDMFAPMGTDVYAMTHGTVVRHSSSRLGGLGLYLAGDDGNLYYYAHLQRILPGYEPGARVEAGELVAANGDSGNARGGAPHVHFQVHPGGGGPVNPYPFTAAACR